LREDHENARRLAAGIDTIPGLACAQADGPATNLVYFTVDGDAVGDPSLDAALLSERLRARGVLANPLGENLQQMRMVTHLDLTREDIDEALSALRSSIDET
jgi:threonine aldolase